MKLIIILLVVLVRRGPRPQWVLTIEDQLKLSLNTFLVMMQRRKINEVSRLFLLVSLPLLLVYLISWVIDSLGLALVWTLFEAALLFLVLSDSKGEDALEEYRVATSCNQQEAINSVGEKWYGITSEADKPHNVFMQSVCRDWHSEFIYPLFWYVLLGVPALVLIMLIKWLQDSGNDNIRDMCVSMEAALQWPSSRLLSLSLGLAGNMSGALTESFKSFTDIDNSGVAAYVSQVCIRAMGLGSFDLKQDDPIYDAAQQAASLHGLIVRNLWVWLVSISILLVFVF